MHPIHDVDTLLLLAVMISSKRRPAELVEIIAAIDLSQESIPSAVKLTQAFARLAEHGLISAVEDRFTLTPVALDVVARLPKKADAAERLFTIRERLGAYECATAQATITLTEDELDAAIAAYRASAQRTGSNQFMPKPKPEQANKRPDARPNSRPNSRAGVQRDKPAARRRG